jgi:MoaA/NifB/PqqE/SkfB family radical SAM enzyme
VDDLRYDFLLHATVRESENWGFVAPDLSGLPHDVATLRDEVLLLSETWQASTENLHRYKAVNYALAMEEWRQGVYDAHALPISVQINPDDHCNLKCVYCRPIGLNFPAGTFKHLAEDKWRPAVEALLPAAVEFLPFCWGEPLLPAARLGEACVAAREFGVSIALITHMNSLDEVHADLFVKHVSRALISVDTANPDRYRKLRVGGTLERVERNIESLRRHARALGISMPWLGVSGVIMAQNLEELPDLIDWVADNGLQGVYAGRLVAPAGIRTFASDELVDLTSSEYLDVFRACSQRSAALGIALSMYDPENPIGANRKCPCPWQHAYVATDGALSFCNFSREIVLDRLPLTPRFFHRDLVASRRKEWCVDPDFRCSGCQSTDYDGRPGVSQFRGQ